MSVAQGVLIEQVEEASPVQVPVGLFALSAAVMITNMFAPQTLIGPMAATLGVPISSSGLIAMDTLLGYAAGLFFLVPLADLVENRKLALRMIALAAACAALVAIVPSVPVLFLLLFALGAACSVIQVLMPLAASLVAPEKRGQVLGDIMSGLMVGILLARPAASFIAGAFGWKAYYITSAVLMAALLCTLIIRMPSRFPVVTASYPKLIGSLWHLLTSEKVLFERSVSAAIVMAAFNFFWTTIAYVLADAPFHFGQFGIAGFALAGAGGALVTPLVGRLADQGHGKRVTLYAHLSLIAGFALAAFSALSASLPIFMRVLGLGISALLLDAGVLGDQTVGRYLINQLNPAARGRINGIFVGMFFIGGAVGSAVSSVLWTIGGWNAICFGGVALGLLALLSRKR